MAPQTHPLSGHLGWSSWRTEWRSWWLKKKEIPAKVESSNKETMLVWQFSWTVSWKRWVTHHCWFGPAGDEKLGPCSSSQLHPCLFTLTQSRTWSSKLQLLKERVRLTQQAKPVGWGAAHSNTLITTHSSLYSPNMKFTEAKSPSRWKR